jgi:hypothetical protein
MKFKRLVLAIVLMALLMPCQSFGYESPRSAEDGTPTAIPTKASVSMDRASICVGSKKGIYLSLDEYSKESICLFTGVTIKRTVYEFKRVQVETRRVKRLAVLTRCAKHVSEEYTDEKRSDGPMAAPLAVKAVICAASEIDTAPYSWDGGHENGFIPGGEEENGGPGYDCSGAVSYALHGGHFIDNATNSEGLETWGEPGKGRWITVYANAEHAWMVVAGIRFDTREPPSGETGPRWHSSGSSPEGFVARHPSGY